ncbi:hypothetical protein GUJ93_ZPchr0012g21427 [Zizania palustris]|uniref:V-SNARE coiled-coil homology domain-containing protein n=1 Tax=Zizania palustris TaxID=103762 RepID=A0A8J5WPT6_ZIZPA|nr:hypothetical protein GUJ93_ZPchr0012g21427 [Zizania palustris]
MPCFNPRFSPSLFFNAAASTASAASARLPSLRPPPRPPPTSTASMASTDDELRGVHVRLGPEAERDAFGLVCRRWLRIQSSERQRLCARAGPTMLRRMAARFSGVLDLDLSQSPSRSFYPGVIDDDLDVIAGGFRNLRVLALWVFPIMTAEHKTIDSVLARGERLDSLVEKSSDLSAALQMFYKQAKKANSCCTIL